MWHMHLNGNKEQAIKKVILELFENVILQILFLYKFSFIVYSTDFS